MGDRSKVLIIGVESFTGGHLRSFLKLKGYDVYGTTLTSSSEKKTFKVDILDPFSVINTLKQVEPDYIINLAAISFVGEKNKELFYNINVLGTEILLESIVESGVVIKKGIFPSSAVLYGDQNTNVLHEGLVPNPKNHYGYSKYILEQICKTFFDKINIVITRPFNYTGVNQSDSFLVPKIVNSFRRKDKKISLGNIHTRREFNDVKFVCEMYERLLFHDVKSEVINVCSGVTHSVRDILDLMQNIAGYEIQVIVDNKFVRKNEIIELKGNPSKLLNYTGGAVDNYTLKKVLHEMYQA